MREKREGWFFFWFLFFCSALKIGFWGLWVTAVKIRLVKRPCTIKHLGRRKSPTGIEWTRENGKHKENRDVSLFFVLSRKTLTPRREVILLRHLRVATKPWVTERVQNTQTGLQCPPSSELPKPSQWSRRRGEAEERASAQNPDPRPAGCCLAAAPLSRTRCSRRNLLAFL